MICNEERSLRSTMEDWVPTPRASHPAHISLMQNAYLFANLATPVTRETKDADGDT